MEPQEIVASPELYPISLDFERHTIRFVRMTREGYRKSSFLDTGRAVVASNEVFEYSTQDLRKHYGNIDNCRTVNYILHCGFACSTLLARYIELIPSCFVLKEPALLKELAMLRSGPVRRGADWDELFDIAMRLFTRVYNGQGVVFIKPHPVCNCLAELLLQRDNRSRAALLLVPLTTFLLSVLKWAERRAWVRERLRDFTAWTPQYFSSLEINIEKLSDAEAAACFWLLTQYIFREIYAHFGPERTIFVNGEELAESPSQTIGRLSSFFGISVQSEELAIIADDQTARLHSKSLKPYDASTRRVALEEAMKQVGTELTEGLEWAEGHGPSNPNNVRGLWIQN